jgi:hypothetical protein
MQIDTQAEIKKVTAQLEKAREMVAMLEPKLDSLLRVEEFYRDESGNGTAQSRPSSTRKPTLNNAILTVIREGSEGGWTALQVMDQLRVRGWMPNGSSAEHVVRAKLAALARGDSPALHRISHGVYELNVEEP